ncbi:hypothetical protein DL98DRAFT_653101 [Cadophora sp. DSE1049]|nr:hypothetical protein DL98DRAFT_653101 [Cadophora sp. DSE1049]
MYKTMLSQLYARLAVAGTCTFAGGCGFQIFRRRVAMQIEEANYERKTQTLRSIEEKAWLKKGVGEKAEGEVED